MTSRDELETRSIGGAMRVLRRSATVPAPPPREDRCDAPLPLHLQRIAAAGSTPVTVLGCGIDGGGSYPTVATGSFRDLLQDYCLSDWLKVRDVNGQVCIVRRKRK